MSSLLRTKAPHAVRSALFVSRRVACPLARSRFQSHNAYDPPKGNPPVPGRGPPDAPGEESAALKDNVQASSYIVTTKRLPEFNLNDKVVLVTGGTGGLGLVQAEALLEAGAVVYALDRLPEPNKEFYRVQKRAADELGTTLHYKQIDVRDVPALNEIVRDISDSEGRMDGLIAAAGIQQETPALDYTAEDANKMFEARRPRFASSERCKLTVLLDQHHGCLYDRTSCCQRNDPEGPRW